MLRRFVVALLAAVALAGVVLLPSPAVAQGRPSVLLCQIGADWVDRIRIDWSGGGMREAVDLCTGKYGGHPIGVDDDGKDPIEPK